MNNRAVTLSVVMAIFAVLMVQSYVENHEEETKAKFGTEVVVVVAAKDITEMSTLDETMVELKTVPKKFLEPASIWFAEAEDGTEERSKRDLKNLAGQVAIVSIKKGEQITYNKLTEPGLRSGLSPQISPGKRAITVPVDEITGVGKLIKPGDRVDIIVVIDGGSKDSKFTKILYQDMVVLAVGRNVTNNIARVLERDPASKTVRSRSLADYDKFSSVTLEVDPAQAQNLAMVMAIGRDAIFLTLRNNDDNERVNLPGVSLMDTLGPDAMRVKQLIQERKGGAGGLVFPR